MADSLFSLPSLRIINGFTTCLAQDLPSSVKHAKLSDDELGVHRVTSSTTHTLVTPPLPVPGGNASTLAWEAVFPAASINPGNKSAPHGGFGFYLRGPAAFSDALKRLSDEDDAEVVFSYDVLFEQGFEWVKGGKLPGIYGGAGDSAYGCTGGRQTDRCKCFNLRLMWREKGAGELYAYLPHSARNTERLLAIPPRSIQHPDYGFSVARGAWKFEPGKWTRVTQRVRVNTLGKENGLVEVYIDGKSVLLATGLVLRTEKGPDGRVQGLHLQTFFGGHSPEWASPKGQRAWFANISGAIVESRHGHDEL
ncbi:hypothetical protein C8Q80DRAFT_1152879 [Daedaleopsis nitida]|nr:hypothetical protein C8Q80DRAFT_1152879 [Daedaleopsis nitida]